ncbi:ABC transporter substrate-binding protein [Plantactinospora sp. GCM10030261]|uniref:ABC transporter substrate-binding protein n=1 Tax=Plantactinospora sp. GCM10030261 TaxID=3273420 RepID=UPI0036101130
MIRRITRALACLAMAGLVGSCGLADADDGRTTIEFFQFKPEGIEAFDRIIAGFEREHPNIRVVQNHVPDADTALRTRLVREDMPDVIALNAGATWKELAPTGIFYDFAGEPVAEQVSPTYQTIVNDLGTAAPGEVNGIPFVANGDGVLYNKKLFAEHGVAVPRTWDELIAAAQTFRDAGITPFYGTIKDAWTVLAAWNALSAYLPPTEFFDRLAADQASFRDDFQPVAQRLTQLFDLAQPDKAARGYNDGNEAFAKGEVAMYLQGTWTLPSVREFKPGFDIGIFPMPTDDPAKAVLVSGVDVAFTMAREPEHKRESLAFISYVMRPDVVTAYAEDQSAVPALRDKLPTDPGLADLIPYIEQERLVGFADHNIPPAIPLDRITQQYLIDGDQAGYLSTLDKEWDKVARRRSR